MTIREIVEKYLKENKYDGLLDTDYGCSCTLDDLMPCGSEINETCQSAYNVKCIGEKCELECDGEKDEKGFVKEGCMTVVKPEAVPCDSCANGTAESCQLNPGGDCVKADYVQHKPIGNAGHSEIIKADAPDDKPLTFEERVEVLSARFHNIYQKEAERQGDVRHARNYADLPEKIKEYDRQLARYVMGLMFTQRNEGEREGYKKAQVDITNGDYELCFTQNDLVEAQEEARQAERKRILKEAEVILERGNWQTAHEYFGMVKRLKEIIRGEVK